MPDTAFVAVAHFVGWSPAGRSAMPKIGPLVFRLFNQHFLPKPGSTFYALIKFVLSRMPHGGLPDATSLASQYAVFGRFTGRRWHRIFQNTCAWIQAIGPRPFGLGYQ